MLFQYSLRSLWQQRGAALPTVIAMLVAVWLVTSMALTIDSVRRTVIDSGRTDNALFHTVGADGMDDGNMPATVAERIRILPSITQEGGRPLAGAELLIRVWTRYVAGLEPEQVFLRGIDPVGYQLHDTIRVLSGRMPQVGEPGILVGASIAGRMENTKVGDMMRIGHHRWPVLGTFAAPGTRFESELLCDRTALAAATDSAAINAVIARVSGPSDIPALASAASAWRDVQIGVQTERDFNRALASGLDWYLGSATLLTFVLMLGTAFAIVSTMYALLLQRSRELATLLAMGYKRRQLIVMLSVETAVLVLIGAAAGLGLASLIIGKPYMFSDWNLVVHITPSLVAFDFPLYMIVGVLAVGIAIATVQVKRIVVLDALRD